mgnify:CR=1 FL=1
MKINSLTHYYKGRSSPVLNQLCIEFDPNKLNVIVGLNGSGKTTLLDIISGVIPSAQFHSPFAEEDVVYQMQGVPLPSIMKGKDIVRLILKCDTPFSFSKSLKTFIGSLTPREKELLNRLWDVRIGDMSVGERRWLIIKSVCQLERKLYIFDEPTAGIDPDTRNYVLSSINRLVKKGKLVIMSTHILHELEFIDCKIHFLHKGRILYEGDYVSFLRKHNTENPDIAFQMFIQEQGGELNEETMFV